MSKIANGEFVAQFLNDGDVDDEQIQPNGVDLRIEELYRTSGNAHFFEDGYEKPNRTLLEADMGPFEDGLHYELPPGRYPVVYAEKVEIPDGYVGRVYPRSRLMRSGLHLTSALWDQNYEGVGEGLLQVPRCIDYATFSEDVPIAQMVFEPAEDAETYDGTHQGERSEKKLKEFEIAND
jgi:deoxycytidine triphosphate deaminase